jgi:hypothetical protein
MGYAERASKEKHQREALLREGLLHLVNGVARIGNALAVTIVATYAMEDSEVDEQGRVDVRTFNYSAFRSKEIGVPHLEQAEVVVRDARTNLILQGEDAEGSVGMEVQGDDGATVGEEALREAEGDDGVGDPDRAPGRPGAGDAAGPDAPDDQGNEEPA